MTKAIREMSFRRLIGTALAIVAVWLIFGVFSASEFHRRVLAAGSDGDFPGVLAFQLFSALMWAIWTPLVIGVAERLPLEEPHRLRNLLLQVAAIPVLAVARSAYGGAALQILLDRIVPTWDFIYHSITVRFGKWCFLTVVIVVITNIVLRLKDNAARERRRVAAETEAMTMKLASLRACVQPRFVFATLEAIRRQIAADPACADRVLVAFSSLLRRMLDSDQRREVTLGEELELVQHYADLDQEVRAGTEGGAPLRLRFALEEEILVARIPPLLLLLVLVNGTVGGGTWQHAQELTVEAFPDGARLRIHVRCRPSLLLWPSTIDETRAQLRQIFDEDFALTTREDADMTEIAIDIPYHVLSSGRAA